MKELLKYDLVGPRSQLSLRWIGDDRYARFHLTMKGQRFAETMFKKIGESTHSSPTTVEELKLDSDSVADSVSDEVSELPSSLAEGHETEEQCLAGDHSESPGNLTTGGAQLCVVVDMTVPTDMTAAATPEERLHASSASSPLEKGPTDEQHEAVLALERLVDSPPVDVRAVDAESRLEADAAAALHQREKEQETAVEQRVAGEKHVVAEQQPATVQHVAVQRTVVLQSAAEVQQRQLAAQQESEETRVARQQRGPPQCLVGCPWAGPGPKAALAAAADESAIGGQQATTTVTSVGPQQPVKRPQAKGAKSVSREIGEKLGGRQRVHAGEVGVYGSPGPPPAERAARAA